MFFQEIFWGQALRKLHFEGRIVEYLQIGRKCWVDAGRTQRLKPASYHSIL